MKALWIKTGVVLVVLFECISCSPRIYQPPKLGAEYQIDRGLPPAKKPSHLFGRKMERDLAKKGILHGEHPGKKTAVTPTRKSRSDSTKTAVPASHVDSAVSKPSVPPENQE